MQIEINTREDLKSLETQLRDLGIYTFNDYEAERLMLEKIISEANKLHLEVRLDELKKKFTGDFNEFRKQMSEHFAGFNEDDKISELVRKLSVAGKEIRDLSPLQKEILKAKGNEYCYWATLLKFNPKSIKFTYAFSRRWEIQELLKRLGVNFELPYFSEYSFPAQSEWSDGEGNTFRLYRNGNFEIRGTVVPKLNELFRADAETCPSILVEN